MSSEILKPTSKTVKRLFAKSGNQCAFRRCTDPIVLETGTVVGKIAHIETESEGGPRYNATQTAEDRRAYENLILLCGKDHDLIDDMPEAFTVEVLQEMKHRHEATATEIEDLVEVAQVAAQLIGSINISTSGANNSTVAGVIQNTTFNHYATAQAAEPAAPYRGRKPAVGLARFTSDHVIGRRVGFGFTDEGGEPITFPESGPCAWFRLWSEASPPKPFTMLALKNASGQGRSLDLVTFCGMADRLVLSADGIGRYQTYDGLQATAVAFLFRSGEIWCADTNIVKAGFNGHDYVNLTEIRKSLLGMLTKHAAVLGQLGTSEPFHWQFGLEGAEGFELSYETTDRRSRYTPPRVTTDVIVVEGIHPSPTSEASPLEMVTEQIFAECGESIPGNLL